MDQGLGPCIWVRLNPDLNWCEILRFVKFGQRFLFPWALLLQLLLWKCSDVIIINHVMLISQSNPCSQTLSHLRLDCQWARITMQKGMDNTVWSKRKWMTHKLFFVVVVFFQPESIRQCTVKFGQKCWNAKQWWGQRKQTEKSWSKLTIPKVVRCHFRINTRFHSFFIDIPSDLFYCISFGVVIDFKVQC